MISFHLHLLSLSRWAQEDVGVPLGVLTESSIEVCNKDVKKANSAFVARVSSERVQRDILMRRSWEADPVLHYEATVRQVGSSALYMTCLLSSYQTGL